MDAKEVIEKIGLTPLPEEGGFYKEVFRDSGQIKASALSHHDGNRCYSSAIYYLVTPDEFSGLHAIKSTEIFHFYAGDPVEMIQIDESGNLVSVVIGNDILAGQAPQVVVAPMTWQGTKLLPGGKWALMGCTVAPGFEFADFINGTSAELIKKFPQHRSIIESYTHV